MDGRLVGMASELVGFSRNRVGKQQLGEGLLGVRVWITMGTTTVTGSWLGCVVF